MLEIQQIACATVAAVGAGRNLNAVLAAAARASSAIDRAAARRDQRSQLRHAALRPSPRLRARPAAEQAVAGSGLALAVAGGAVSTRIHARGARMPSSITRCAAPPRSAIRRRAASSMRCCAIFSASARRCWPRRSQSEVGRYSFPQWWIYALRAQYPQHYAPILEAGNTHPPLTLRVNCRRTSVADYLAELARDDIAAEQIGDCGGADRTSAAGRAAAGICRRARSRCRTRPRSSPRRCSTRSRACGCSTPAPRRAARPPICSSARRSISSPSTATRRGLQRVRQNLERLGLDAHAGRRRRARRSTRGGTAGRSSACWPTCRARASGVVRRHPDIKWLRRAGDIGRFASQQRALLDTLWQVLASGGKLLYATCSVFDEENSRQVEDFLARHADARRLPLSGAISTDGIPEGQLLPDNEHDGFFYALLQKI